MIKQLFISGVIVCIAGVLFWPRNQIGPPHLLDSYIQSLSPFQLDVEKDTMLSLAAEAFNQNNWPLGDSMLAEIPDTTSAWIDARMARSYYFLKRKLPATVVRLLDVPLPDSLWNWPAERHEYLVLARFQTGDVKGGFRYIDSIPEKFPESIIALINKLEVFSLDTVNNLK